jgi:MFS superfamily sulfate permease-like transporter
MIIGFLVIVAGWVFQITANIDGASGGNAGTILQLIGTLSIIVGLVILAIGFFRFTRMVERHIYSQP